MDITACGDKLPLMSVQRLITHDLQRVHIIEFLSALVFERSADRVTAGFFHHEYMIPFLFHLLKWGGTLCSDVLVFFYAKAGATKKSLDWI